MTARISLILGKSGAHRAPYSVGGPAGHQQNSSSSRPVGPTQKQLPPVNFFTPGPYKVEDDGGITTVLSRAASVDILAFVYPGAEMDLSMGTNSIINPGASSY